MASRLLTLAVSLSLLVSTVLASSVLATTGDAKVALHDTDDQDNDTGHTISSDDALEMGMISNSSLTIEAERALTNNHVDKAILLLRRALKENYDDADTHVALAEALERKLEQTSKPNPGIFIECAAEWLAVMRNQFGEEQGMNLHGLGFTNHYYGDDDHEMLAKRRLLALTGTSPHPWETNNKFLKRVGRLAETKVAARLVNADTARN